MRVLGKGAWLLGIILLTAFTVPVQVRAQAGSAAQYLAAGQQLFGAKNYAQASQYYYAAVKLDPNNVTAYQGIGNCYYMLGRKSDALAFYQKALAIQPGNAQLSQFVQNLQAQINAGGAASGGAMGMTPAGDPLTQGAALFQQKQYAAAIPYFGRAIQQNPNDYRGYYYAGYTYYMMGNARYAALYFAVANLKQPNASIQAYADRVKAGLPQTDQQWVSDQVAKFGGSTGGGGGSNSGMAFGFHFLGGSSYIFANPSQIINGVQAAQTISLNGNTPNMIALVGLQPYLQFGDSFELDLGAGYIPVGTLSYKWLSPGAGMGYQVSFDTSLVQAQLGLKILFGDSKMKTYIGLGGIVAPLSTNYSKVPTDGTGALTGAPADPSSGSYSTMAMGGYAQLGMDFYLGKGLAIGPFVGVQVLSATDFKGTGGTLLVDQSNGDLLTTANTQTTPLTMDFSNVNVGAQLTLSF